VFFLDNLTRKRSGKNAKTQRRKDAEKGKEKAVVFLDNLAERKAEVSALVPPLRLCVFLDNLAERKAEVSALVPPLRFS
jgi:hypothetical protein